MLQFENNLTESTLNQPRVSVIIPAYNEASKGRKEAFEEHLREWSKQVEQDRGLFVVVVNDGSHDDTTKIVDNYGLPLLSHPGGHNKGKGASLTLGLRETSGIRAFTDADGSYAPSFVLRLTESIEAGSDIAIAVRPEGDNGHQTLLRHIGHIGLGYILEKIAPTGGIRDVQGGAKALSDNVAKQLIPHLNVAGYAWDRQLLHKAAKEKLRIDQVVVPDGSFHSVGDSHVKFIADSTAMVVSALKIRNQYP
jgi:glycosyltransferase involved in cell wall biosynthesis